MRLRFMKIDPLTPVRTPILAATMLLALFAAGPVAGQDAVPAAIPYSGFLELSNNALSADIEVRLQREDPNGVFVTVWCERHQATPLKNRRFHINIGRPAGNPEPCAQNEAFALEDDLHDLFAKGEVWLELWVNGTGLPRQQFLTVPYAAVARTANDFTVLGQLTVKGNINTVEGRLFEQGVRASMIRLSELQLFHRTGDDGTSHLDLGYAADGRSVCFLVKFESGNVWRDDNVVRCEVQQMGANWHLSAETRRGGDQGEVPDVYCGARCISW